MKSSAREIGAYVSKVFIEPARRAGRDETSLTAGDVHKDLRLQNRMPAVCSTTDSKEFQDHFGLVLRQRTGPPQRATVTWFFSLLR